MGALQLIQRCPFCEIAISIVLFLLYVVLSFYDACCVCCCCPLCYPFLHFWFAFYIYITNTGSCVIVFRLYMISFPVLYIGWQSCTTLYYTHIYIIVMTTANPIEMRKKLVWNDKKKTWKGKHNTKSIWIFYTIVCRICIIILVDFFFHYHRHVFLLYFIFCILFIFFLSALFRYRVLCYCRLSFHFSPCSFIPFVFYAICVIVSLLIFFYFRFLPIVSVSESMKIHE